MKTKKIKKKKSIKKIKINNKKIIKIDPMKEQYPNQFNEDYRDDYFRYEGSDDY